MPEVLAIVGRPNVGKSALFNRIVGRRMAIVHDEPGVTRDRVSAEAEWRGRSFTVVDTGGIGLVRGETAPDDISRVAMEQVEVAIESADVIILVVSIQDGLVGLDDEVARRLRQAGKPVVIAANKADIPAREQFLDEFAGLGFETILPISALHDRGISDLLAKAVSLMPQQVLDSGIEEAAREVPFKLAIVGRPNVGKSSIINALTKSERVVVSAVPGTTRDAVDVPFVVETEGRSESFLLIDTAGMRKKRRVRDSIEFFSVKRTEDSIERCDLAVLVLDAEAGITEQDKKIADSITQNRKACLIVVNKWDLVEPQLRQARQEMNRRRKEGGNQVVAEMPPTTLKEFGEWVQKQLFFLNYAPVIFASAYTGTNLERLLEAIRYVQHQLQKKIPTALLNRTLLDAVRRKPPVSRSGHPLKVYYATQVQQAPPTFLLFVNRKDAFAESYVRFLSGELRKAFGLEGCPIRLSIRPRPKKVAPVRNHPPKKSRKIVKTARRRSSNST